MLGLGLGLHLRGGLVNPPTMGLDLKAASLPALLSFSRGSVGWDVQSGQLVQYASGAPRISGANGLLIEESRTNSVRNSVASGATLGVIGSGGAAPNNWSVIAASGITTEVVSTGTRNGFDYVELRMSGTPSGTSHQIAFEGSTTITAAEAEKWSSSCFVALSGGSLANISSVDVRCCEIASGVFATASQTAFGTLSTQFARQAAQRTMAAGTTSVQPRLRLNLTSGNPIDITLQIAAPQCEKGVGATSPIITSGSATTRASDIVDFANVSFITQGIGTWVFDAVSNPYGYDTSLSINTRILDLNPGSSVETIGFGRILTSGSALFQATAASVQQWSISPSVWALGAAIRLAARYDVNEAAACTTGSAVVTDTSIPNGIPTITAGSVGRRSGSVPNGGWLNGYLRSMAYWNRKFTDNEMLAAVA